MGVGRSSPRLRAIAFDRIVAVKQDTAVKQDGNVIQFIVFVKGLLTSGCG